MQSDVVNWQRFAASGFVGSGPVIIYGFNFVSNNIPGVLVLRDASSKGVSVVEETGIGGTGKTFSFGGTALSFPNGCYVDLTRNIVQATIFYTTV